MCAHRGCYASVTWVPFLCLLVPSLKLSRQIIGSSEGTRFCCPAISGIFVILHVHAVMYGTWSPLSGLGIRIVLWDVECTRSTQNVPCREELLCSCETRNSTQGPPQAGFPFRAALLLPGPSLAFSILGLPDARAAGSTALCDGFTSSFIFRLLG